MELHLKVIGLLLVSLALVHVIFPKYFNWTDELGKLSLINRQMVYVHTFFIALVLLLIGVLCLTSSTELIETELGNRIAFGLGLFWVTRLFTQFFVYSPALWRGKRFETVIHILFSLLWTYFSFVFFYIFWIGT